MKKIFLHWIKEVVPLSHHKIEITIRLVDIEEIHILNFIYRNKNYPTNILAFPYITLLNMKLNHLLGDLVICSNIIEYEAKQQKKTMEAHWAHIVIHGTLHLLGYTHNSVTKTIQMEKLETIIMKKLGYPNPYLI